MQEKTLSVLEQPGGKSLNTRGFKSIELLHIENARAAWVPASPGIPPSPGVGQEVAPQEIPSLGDPAPRPAAGMPQAGAGMPEGGNADPEARAGGAGSRRDTFSLCFTKSSSKPKDFFFLIYFFFFL